MEVWNAFAVSLQAVWNDSGFAAFTMGKVIGMIGDKMDQHVRFESFMTKRV